MLRQKDKKRKLKNNLQLAALTAVAAGMVNVSSVIAFFAFTSNVTGHMAILTEEIVKGHWHQVLVVFSWLFLFFFGAFTANYLISSLQKRGPYLAHSAPVVLEILALLVVAYYGTRFYAETLRETEYLIAALLFAMGIQNGLVATISNGVVKTTHLTGLFTDLGMEVAQYLNPNITLSQDLMDKLHLHFVIAGFYFLGGIVGGFFFLNFTFGVFYVVVLVLLVVLYYDLTKFVAYKTKRNMSPRRKKT